MTVSDPPTVSVLMPLRNAAPHLDEALASLVSQRFDDLEVVCVDDGSTDETAEIVDRWSARDPRVRLDRQAARGIVPALTRAHALSRGRLLARMDGDDIAAPNRILRQVEWLEVEPTSAGCGCHVRYFPRRDVRAGARRYEGWLNSMRGVDDVAASIFVECPLAHPTFVLRRAAFEEVGGYRDVPWPEDYDLVFRLWAGGHRLGVVPEVLHEWREHPERLSRVDSRYALDAFRACKVHYLLRTLLSEPRPVVVWGAGPVGKGWARALQAEGVRVVAFVDVDPRKIGQTIHGAPVLDGASYPGAGLDELFGAGWGPYDAASARPLHLAAVGQPGARDRIIGLLEGAGSRALEDFVAVA